MGNYGTDMEMMEKQNISKLNHIGENMEMMRKLWNTYGNIDRTRSGKVWRDISIIFQ
jgi:hypothetical protein